MPGYCLCLRVMKTRAIMTMRQSIGQTAGLSGSLPLGYIITDLGNRLVPFVCFGISKVVDFNRGDDIFGTLKLNEWPVLCSPGCKMFLLNPNVFISRGTLIGR